MSIQRVKILYIERITPNIHIIDIRGYSFNVFEGRFGNYRPFMPYRLSDFQNSYQIHNQDLDICQQIFD